VTNYGKAGIRIKSGYFVLTCWRCPLAILAHIFGRDGGSRDISAFPDTLPRSSGALLRAGPAGAGKPMRESTRIRELTHIAVHLIERPAALPDPACRACCRAPLQRRSEWSGDDQSGR
jgi:hypothetical protein